MKNNSVVSKLLVLKAKVTGVKALWEKDGCSIENKEIKKTLTKFASNLEEYVQSLGLLQNMTIIDRFDREGVAWVEVYIQSKNKEFGEIEGQVEAVRKEISKRLTTHREKLHSISNRPSTFEKVETNSRGSVEALMKCISHPSNFNIEFDFEDGNIEVVPTIRAIGGRVTLPEIRKIVGLVKMFDDATEAVQIFQIEGVVGNVTLRVRLEEDRMRLLQAQLERRQVTVEFEPSQNILKPESDARQGTLVKIVSVGPTQEKLRL